MKKILLSAAILFAAHVHGQTTADEYNYITKGYHRVITESADVKAGYKTIKLLDSDNVDSDLKFNHNFIIGALAKTNEEKPRAYIVVFGYKGTLNKIYCFPAPGSAPALYKNFEASINDMGTAQKTLLLRCLFQVLAETKK